ncbi:MAG: hypothetical protein NVSMB44_19300 [Ktedonobacteraceae bacterium]
MLVALSAGMTPRFTWLRLIGCLQAGAFVVVAGVVVLLPQAARTIIKQAKTMPYCQ